MLRRLVTATGFRTTHILCLRHISAEAASAAPASTKEKWDLYAGVLVERLPVVSKTPNALEKQFQELLWRVEYEKSLKSNHEIKHEHELRQAELLKKGKIEVDLEDASSKQTAQDSKDAYTEELKAFQLAARTTHDDSSNNVASTNRCLEDTLYLLVEQKLGKQAHLLLPQGPRLDGETMRQAAERVLREKCGEQLQVQFYGNAPCGFYKYKYPGAMREQSIGAKVFFYRATLRQGNVDQAAVGQKFEWLAKGALDGKLKNVAYTESIQKFLL